MGKRGSDDYPGVLKWQREPMNCETCNKNHDGLYGSGRFCSSKCARSYSTKSKRKEINAKVKAKLKGRSCGSNGFKKGYDPNRVVWNSENKKQATSKRLETLAQSYITMDWDDLPMSEKRRRISSEQNEVCLECGMRDWRGKPLTLELDHINGEKADNRRENLRILCPNCHSQTPTFRRYTPMAEQQRRRS